MIPITTRHALGMTLIELLAVMVILGIIAVTAVNRYDTTTLNLGASADQLASDLRYTQTLELTRGQSYCLALTGAGYQIRDATCTTAVTNPGSGTATGSLAIGVTVATTLPNQYVAFYGAGVPYVSATTPLATTATITLADGAETRVISISPETGHVTVQ